MATYRLTWEIELDALTPLDAAREAVEFQRTMDSVFTVTDTKTNEKIEVDLADDWE